MQELSVFAIVFLILALSGGFEELNRQAQEDGKPGLLTLLTEI